MTTNEIKDLLDAIKECSDKITSLGMLLQEFTSQLSEALSQTAEAPSSVPATETAETEEIPKTEENTNVPEEQPPAYSFEDVRKAFAAKSHAGHTSKVKALIQKYGAERLSDINKEDYPKLMAELEVI